MGFLRHWGMAAKFGLGVLIGMLGTVISAGLLFYATVTTAAHLDSAASRMAVSQTAADAALCVSELARSARTVMVSWNVLVVRKDFTARATQCEARLEGLGLVLRRDAPELAPSLAAVHQALTGMGAQALDLWTQAEARVGATADGKLIAAQAATDQALEALQGMEAQQALALAALKHINSVLQEHTNTFLEETAHLQQRLLWLCGLAMVVCALLSVWLGMWTSKSVTGPLLRFLTATERITQSGVLSEDVVVEGSDEVARLAASFGAMLRRLRGLAQGQATGLESVTVRLLEVGRTVTNASQGVTRTVAQGQGAVESLQRDFDAVAQSAVALGSHVKGGVKAAEQSTEANHQMADTVEAMAKGVHGAVEDMHTVAHSIRELGTLIVRASRLLTGADALLNEMHHSGVAMREQAALSKRSSENAAHEARAAEGELRAALDSIERIRVSTTHAAAITQQLDETVRRIPLILEVIDRVGSRINLLALNASILAAQSGAAGTAFNVVAQEITTLAAGTAQSTREIGETVKALLRASSQAASAMQGGATQVDEGVALGNRAGDALRRILNGVAEGTSAVEQLASAAETQHEQAGRTAAAVGNLAKDIAAATVAVQGQSTVLGRLEQRSRNLEALAQDVVASASRQRGPLGTVTAGMTLMGNLAKNLNAAQESQAGGVRALTHAMRGIANVTTVLSSQVGELESAIAALASQEDSVRRQAGNTPPKK